ncbi:PAS domain S-box protein [Parvibaculum sp.]|uniref:PAS domain S-box protein n=1 Tax=Parvibaculum sp. TaxID=2024848 RepID=UPI003BA8F7B0
MVVTGSDGIIRSASPAWTRILGYPVEDVVGRNFIDFIYPEDVGLSHGRLPTCARGRRSHGFRKPPVVP